MFNSCPTNFQIPSLTFTKAELVYALSVLMGDISPTDNETVIEMVELRFYLNKIKERIALAASNGTLRRAMPHSSKKEGECIPSEPEAAEAPSLPSMSELREQFPSLTDEEITEILANAREEREKEEAERKKNEPPPAPEPPSFVVKKALPKENPKTPEEEKRRENAKRFAELLGTF